MGRTEVVLRLQRHEETVTHDQTYIPGLLKGVSLQCGFLYRSEVSLSLLSSIRLHSLQILFQVTLGDKKPPRKGLSVCGPLCVD